MSEAGWGYITSMNFEEDRDKISPKLILAYEKTKYKKSIMPKIKELEKEIKTKKEDNLCAKTQMFASSKTKSTMSRMEQKLGAKKLESARFASGRSWVVNPAETTTS